MSFASQENMEKMQLRQNYRNLWHSDLISTMQADFPYCCLALWCAPCVSYMLRKRALYNDMSSSVASTRFLLQDEFNIQTTQCDNCIIAFMFFLQQIACIFSIIAMIVGSNEIQEAAQILSCFSDMVYCSVCACMQTQHKIEMDKRDGKFGPASMMAAPPFQQMSRIEQPIPPSVGYPPQQAYGQPYGYPPSSQGYGYPPAAYPPPAYSSAPYPPPRYPPAG